MDQAPTWEHNPETLKGFQDIIAQKDRFIGKDLAYSDRRIKGNAGDENPVQRKLVNLELSGTVLRFYFGDKKGENLALESMGTIVVDHRDGSFSVIADPYKIRLS